jgi:quercetin dioxygenase-like cupin family protein
MVEIINLGSRQLRFLQSKDDTAGSLDMFEMTLQPNARMPIPHYHESWDETIYGLTGTTTWRVDGKDIDLTSGETVFIKRGIYMVLPIERRSRRHVFARSVRA